MIKKNIEEEINFKDLLKNPLRLFGFSYLYFFVVLLGLGILYVKNLENISYNNVPASYIDSLNIERDIPIKKGGSMPAMDLALISKPSDEIINNGKELFAANCQSCHGEQGNGDGSASAALNPKPRNFHQKDGWTNGKNFSDMYKTLQEGIIKNGMSAYEYLPPIERVSLIHFIRTLDSFPEITETEVTGIDATYGLSENIMLPNQIPIKLAMEKIISENSKSKIFIPAEVENLLQNNSVNMEQAEIALLNASKSASFDAFINSVANYPADFALKSTIKNISRDEWQKLYKFFSKS